MNYNIYNHINDQEFLKIQKRLVVIEEIMANKLMSLGWKLTMPIEKNDALIVDFTFEENFFYGNIGLTYIDEPGSRPGFSFYVTKCYDEYGKRYFVRQLIYENKKLIFYEQKIDLVLNEAITLYNLWDKEFLYRNNTED